MPKIGDPSLALFRQAHEAILRVAPRAHDAAVLAIAKRLRDGATPDDDEVAGIVTETDPVAITIRAWLRGYVGE